MTDSLTRKEEIEGSFIAGDIAAGELFELIQNRLEELQAASDLTQAELAFRIGASEQQVSKWLAQPRNMTIKSAGRLFHALRAHLKFDLDRYETIAIGNQCAPAFDTTFVVIKKEKVEAETEPLVHEPILILSGKARSPSAPEFA